MQDSSVGQLLVASTLAGHPIYAGGVCLVVHEDDEQTIGVMLNRPLQPNVEAMKSLMEAMEQGVSTEDSKEEYEDYEPSYSDFAQELGGGEFDADSSEFDADSSEDDVLDIEELEEEEMLAELDEWEEVEAAMAAPNRLQPYFETESSDDEQASVTDEQTLMSDQTGMTPLGQLHFGGPVSGPVVALHGTSELAEMETGAGIYVAAQRDHLEELVRKNDDRFRLIVGHLRWAPGALQSEIDAGLWHPLPATAEQVFAPAAGMWPRLIRRATSRSVARWIGAKDLGGRVERN